MNANYRPPAFYNSYKRSIMKITPRMITKVLIYVAAVHNRVTRLAINIVFIEIEKYILTF